MNAPALYFTEGTSRALLDPNTTLADLRQRRAMGRAERMRDAIKRSCATGRNVNLRKVR